LNTNFEKVSNLLNKNYYL